MPADPLPADPSLSNQASNQGAQGAFYGPVTVQNSPGPAPIAAGHLATLAPHRCSSVMHIQRSL